MHYRTLIGKEYLAAEDLPEGRDVTMTISRVGREKVRDPALARDKSVPEDQKYKVCGIVYFEELERRHHANPSTEPNRRMVLNTTNAQIVAELYGENTDSWLGRRIALYRTKVKVGGKSVPAIRVREQKPLPKDGKSKEPDLADRDAEVPPADDAPPEDGQQAMPGA